MGTLGSCTLSYPTSFATMSGYFIYCRKSTRAEDRQVLSIESQERELKETAARLNLPVLEVLTEARSAKVPGRPVFNEMMQRLYRGEAEGIICWKLDRLARNPVDGGAIIWALKQHGLKVFTPAQSYGHADDNVILMYIEFGMAQKYIDDLSRNVKRGLKTKVEKGWCPGLAPLGYLNRVIKNKGERDLVKDPERFPLIRRMWDLMLTGTHTPPQILKIANEEWGFRTRQMRKLGSKPLSRAGIYRLFTDPFYYGWFEYPNGSGQWYQGKHKPVVTRDEFERVQALLGRGGSARPRAQLTFAYTGLIRCGECNGMVTAEEKHQLICTNCRFKFAYRNKKQCPRCHTQIEGMSGPVFRRYTYYHCAKSKNPNCSQRSIQAHELEKQIEDYLSRIQISEAFKTWAIKYLHELHANEVVARNEILRSQETAYADCLKRLDNLIALKTAPQNANGELLSDLEYGRQRSESLKEKARLEQLLRDTGHRVERWVELTEKTFEFACSIRKRFADSDTQDKKEILVAIGSNLILKGKKLFIEAKKPFLILETSLPRIKPENNNFEPEKNTVMQRQNAPFGAPCLSFRGQRDKVRTYGIKERKLVRSIYHFFRSLPNPTAEYLFLRRN